MKKSISYLGLGLTALLMGVMSMCSTENIQEAPVNKNERINALIEKGEYASASQLIAACIEGNHFSEQESKQYLFEVERMQRIRKDFTASEDDVLTFIRQYYPEVTPSDILHWGSSKALEFKIIDGEKLYFARAARNLFRIDKKMRQVWGEKHPDADITSGSGAGLDLDAHNAQVISAANTSRKQYVEPRRLHITQRLEVKADEVPAGELIKCWIPYPRLIEDRQENIDLVKTLPAEHILAAPDALQRTIYMEQTAVAGQSAHFSVEYEFTSHAVFQAIDPDKVTSPTDQKLLDKYLTEESPHIVFTPALRELSAQIIGTETNPYLKAQLLFAWVDNNTPWASAREYSSIKCIPEYALENGHGDCGIQTLFFITLCRMNGIPARWQSGWELQPPDDSMHDWGMIYYEPYGWVPMDVTYGLRKSDDPALHWFYLSGMDTYRIIFNDDISQTFTPPKEHIRSETVDSQRGEVEWTGGNLYFDQWRWNFDWEIIE